MEGISFFDALSLRRSVNFLKIINHNLSELKSDYYGRLEFQDAWEWINKCLHGHWSCSCAGLFLDQSWIFMGLILD